jgi:hypothetical protein
MLVRTNGLERVDDARAGNALPTGRQQDVVHRDDACHGAAEAGNRESRT